MQHMWTFFPCTLMHMLFLDGGVHLGGHPTGCISAYGDMHSLYDDGEVVTTTSLLIESEGELSVEPFQLNDQST